MFLVHCKQTKNCQPAKQFSEKAYYMRERKRQTTYLPNQLIKKNPQLKQTIDESRERDGME